VKPESVLIMLGYMVAAVLILMITDHLDAEGWFYQALAAGGAVPLGYWCAYCDSGGPI